MTITDVHGTTMLAPLQENIVMGSGCENHHEKEAALQMALRKSGCGDLRRIRISLSHDQVQLVGRAPSYYIKQLAQESVRPLVFGLHIDNQIRVDFNR